MILASAAPSTTTTTILSVGKHITTHVFGLTVNIDTVISTLVAGAIVIGLGLFVSRKATSGVPSRMQLVFETVVGGVSDQVEASIGPAGKAIVPLAVTLFLFILVANLFDFLPTGHNPQYLPAPTGDINFPIAMALFVIILVHATWIRKQGLRSYLRHYTRPYFVLTPFNIIEELVKPITLTLRLFGNIFAGGLMLALIASLIPANFIVPIPAFDFVWKLFDGLLIGPLQAFIFALLTVLYFESAYVSSPEGH